MYIKPVINAAADNNVENELAALVFRFSIFLKRSLNLKCSNEKKKYRNESAHNITRVIILLQLSRKASNTVGKLNTREMQSAICTAYFATSSAACYFDELYAYPEEIRFVHDIDGDGKKN